MATQSTLPKKLIIALEARLQAQALARHLGRRAFARNLASRLARRNQAHPMVRNGPFSMNRSLVHAVVVGRGFNRGKKTTLATGLQPLKYELWEKLDRGE